jgi:hypothetical protein
VEGPCRSAVDGGLQWARQARPEEWCTKGHHALGLLVARFVHSAVKKGTRPAQRRGPSRGTGSYLAMTNSSRTIREPSPMYFCTSSEPDTRMNVQSVWWATARASRVFPVPGGPYSSTPCKHHERLNCCSTRLDCAYPRCWRSSRHQGDCTPSKEQTQAQGSAVRDSCAACFRRGPTFG